MVQKKRFPCRESNPGSVWVRATGILTCQIHMEYKPGFSALTVETDGTREKLGSHAESRTRADWVRARILTARPHVDITLVKKEWKFSTLQTTKISRLLKISWVIYKRKVLYPVMGCLAAFPALKGSQRLLWWPTSHAGSRILPPAESEASWTAEYHDKKNRVCR
ncbi:hypothetical protein AVEN_137657-1 [Araneus ventricosus]|uniref:Uncharacterized protein n=1 Tax=Araneus ventricosus TaxID=182803 RepID=A0A4Y2RYP6_ARAVE|nr:hypothetical protein AVEN_137657-1 [Araneus ventricosus]